VDIEKPTGQAAPGALHKHSRLIALHVVAGQIVVALSISLILTMAFGSRFGYSALVGAGIGILPSYYLAVRMFKRTGRSMSPEQALRGIYVGEGIKVTFTVALFVLAVRMLDVELAAVMLTYVAIVAVNWVAVFVADLGESPREHASEN
jgi:F0F1-type ATP synthase assembly protein I